MSSWRDPAQWGLPPAALGELEFSLLAFHDRYAAFYRPRTRDTSSCGLRYLTALLRLESDRNFTRIDRLVQKDGQVMPHFMSNSPWSARALLRQIGSAVAHCPEFKAGGWLLLDESSDEKASSQSIGAGRQYNGRLGKVEMSQTGVFLAFSTGHEWLWLDGELFLPEAWFGAQKKKLGKRLGLPKERVFATKIELGWEMVERVANEGSSPSKGWRTIPCMGVVSGCGAT